MRRSTPSGRPDDRGAVEERFGAEPARAVAGARRRAVRDGDRQTDTAHLLHGLLECDRRVQELLGPGPLVGKLLGYLVQRSIGYGLRWRGTVEGAAQGTATSGTRGEGADAVAGEWGRSAGWSPAARAAVHRAARGARHRGAPVISGVDLFMALLADRECRAVEVLRGAGLDPEGLAVLATKEVRSYRDDTTVGS